MHIGRLDLLSGRLQHLLLSSSSPFSSGLWMEERISPVLVSISLSMLIDTRTGEILSSIHKPLENGDDDDNSKCCNTVIYIGRKNFTGPRVDITLDALDTMPTREEVETPNMHEKMMITANAAIQ
jgi:hypothetical protein